MKITKTRLKQIIKEELGRVLNEEEQSPEVAEIVDEIRSASTEEDFKTIDSKIRGAALYAHERSFLFNSLGDKKEELGLTPYTGAPLGHKYGPKVNQ
jgi:alkyl hydroperoxide reductase subunit AhpF